MVKVKSFVAFAVAFGMLAAGQPVAAAATVSVGLGTAAPFAILAGTPDVTNTGPSIVTGDIGIHPASAVSGFPPGILIGTIHPADAVALQAKSDLVVAYDDAKNRTGASVVTGGILGGQTLVSGVYNAGGNTLDLTGTVTLDGQNDPSSVWIFQATSDLITASSSRVAFINGGDPCNVFWQVTSSATLGSDSNFSGTILALTSITMNNGVTMSGRALARNGTVTLINDRITTPTCAAPPGPTPTPTATPTAAPSATPTATPSGSPTGSPGGSPSSSPTGSSTRPSTGPSAGIPTPPSPTGPPVNNVPKAPGLPTPNGALPPTDTTPDGEHRGTRSTLLGPLVALGGLLILAWVVIGQRRRVHR